MLNKDIETNYILKYEKVRVDTMLKPKKLMLIKKEGIICFEYAGEPEKNEIETEPKKKRTTEKEAEDFIMRKIISDKVQGINLSSKANILEEAKKSNLTPSQVEDVLQGLASKGKLSTPKKGFYSLVQEGGEVT